MSVSPITRVVVFAKAPEPGAVKTRLIPALGAGGAAVLAARMIRRTLATVAASGLGPIELWCAPDVSHPLFALCQRDFGVTLHLQRGADLGERMANALEDTLRRCDHALLIGCDIPLLRADDLRQARDALHAGTHAVLGPTVDGGYYLIGLSASARELFAEIRWGSPQVLSDTRERLQSLQWTAREVALHWDVDTPEDLDRLARNPATVDLLAQLSLAQTVDFARASNDTRAS